MTGRPWTTTDCDYLRRYYQRKGVVQLSIELDRTPASIKTMAQTLGVARPGRKGCVPWNKGASYTCNANRDTRPQPIPRPTLGPWDCVW